MRLTLLLGLLVMVLALQITALNIIQVGGVKPDLILMMVVFHAFIRGSREGAFLGFVGGLMQDMVTGGFFGLNALAKMAAGYMVGMAENRLYKDSVGIVVVIMFLATFFSQLVQYSLLAYLKIGIPPMIALTQVIVPMSLYNAAMVPFLYGWFYRSSKAGWLREREP